MNFMYGIDVVEEPLVAGAEVVESRFAVGRESEAMLGTLAVAGEANFALATILGQRITFGVAELHLLRGLHEPIERLLQIFPKRCSGYTK